MIWLWLVILKLMDNSWKSKKPSDISDKNEFEMLKIEFGVEMDSAENFKGSLVRRGFDVMTEKQTRRRLHICKQK